jgi:phospholipase C
LTDDDGDYIGASVCNALYGNSNPPVPYGPENEAVVPSTLSEEGFKNVRGYLTEGRYLTFEMNGYAITNPSTKATDITGTRATADHSDIAQRWVLHALDGTAVHGGQGAGVFMISSALDGRYLHDRTSLGTGTSGAENYTIADLGNGDGYTLVTENGKYLTINPTGNIDITGDRQRAFQIYSVTYQS